MASVHCFPVKAAGAHRLLAGLPSETTPLVITLPSDLSSAIRRAAGWAGQSPEAQALAYLRTGFTPGSGR